MDEKVKRMIERPGVYIAGDRLHPGAIVILVSKEGKIYGTTLDQELDPERFLDTLEIKGSFFPNRKTMTGLDIKRAKFELYHALLEAKVEDYTEGDIEVMCCLAKDPEIQRVFSDAHAEKIKEFKKGGEKG